MSAPRRAFATLAMLAALAGCTPVEPARPGHRAAPPPPAATDAAAEPSSIRFSDVTEEAGIRFLHQNHASAEKLLPETMGSGCAFFDYDGDGRADLYLVNGAPLAADPSAAQTGILYRNLDGLHFADVTTAAGLAGRPFYGMGTAVADIDNDGDLDLLLTGVGEDRLHRNTDGHFEDATAQAGFSERGFSSSAAFLDYDRDGLLDVFIGRYVSWDPQHDIACSPDGRHRTYCTPERYEGVSSRLYRNLDGRRFEDVTAAAGLWRPEGKTLGVAVIDLGQDGWPDLAVANDTVRNFLYANNRDGTFSETGVAAGLAYSESGSTRGGMGIASADVDSDGHEDVLIGNFSHEMASFYRGSAAGYFRDDAAQLGLGLPTLTTVAFGLQLVDLDGDSWLDVVVANGHIEPDIDRLRGRQSFAQPLLVFLNLGARGFEPVAPSGPQDPLGRTYVGRGLCSADIDGDGDVDLALTQNGRAAVLLRNEAAPHAWLRIELAGHSSNRTGYGTRVRAVAGSLTLDRTLRSGGSYLSSSEPVLTLGLGTVESLDRLELSWPSGRKQTIEAPRLSTTLRVHEPE